MLDHSQTEILILFFYVTVQNIKILYMCFSNLLFYFSISGWVHCYVFDIFSRKNKPNSYLSTSWDNIHQNVFARENIKNVWKILKIITLSLFTNIWSNALQYFLSRIIFNVTKPKKGVKSTVHDGLKINKKKCNVHECTSGCKI